MNVPPRSQHELNEAEDRPLLPNAIEEHAARMRRSRQFTHDLATFSAGGRLTTPTTTDDQDREFAGLYAERMRHVIEVFRARKREMAPVLPQPVSQAIIGMIRALEDAAKWKSPEEQQGE